MGKYWLAGVDGISDRDAAMELRGTKLWIDRDTLPALEDEEEFYIQDLVGLDVITENGTKAGSIITVENFGAGDLLEIRPLSGDTYYLPFTKKNVPDINIKDRQVVIRNTDHE